VGTWSVAAHSVMVEALCPEDLQPWALLHDGHEAFLGDFTDPAVNFLCLNGTGTAVRNAIANSKGKLDRQIAAAWQVSVRALAPDLRRADHIALRAEAFVFMGTEHEFQDDKDVAAFRRAVSIIDYLPRDWRPARDLWLSRVDSHALFGRMTPPANPYRLA
jgi:5'-deoxynucleotidase YfbR-like HD superfamily hydrolase